MATIKSHTDLGQSQRLAKILNHESADMYYQYVLPKSGKIMHNPKIGNPINALEWYNKGYTTSGKEPITLDEYCVPCWSLAALLNYLKSKNKFPEIKELSDGRFKLTTYIWDGEHCIQVSIGDTIVDACCELILKLHELKML